jgi:hypothetical protein
MRHKINLLPLLLLLAGMINPAACQTNCVWLERSENGMPEQKIGLSIHLVKLMGKTGGTWDVDGQKVSFDTLLAIYNSGSTGRINDSAGTGVTKISGGTFDLGMTKVSPRHNYLFVESTDSGDTMKISKLRVESIEAVGIVLAMIGSKNFDEDIDKIESALERGGFIYIRDFKKDSRVWIYVN